MKLGIFSIYDKAVGAYLRPFYARSKLEAVRMFSQACLSEKDQFSASPADYHLAYLGEFDDNSGLFEPLIDPERVVSALEVVADAARQVGRSEAP